MNSSSSNEKAPELLDIATLPVLGAQSIAATEIFNFKVKER